MWYILNFVIVKLLKPSAAASNYDTPSRFAAVKLTAIVNPNLLVSLEMLSLVVSSFDNRFHAYVN